MFNTPILFLIFNRPDVTARVFAEIRKQKPKYLYIAADGARETKIGEKELCEESRSLILSGIDWDCEVKTLFRDKNLGCGLAVSQAITWFFDNVEQGIILEDDCLPNESFFGFCEELLIKYKDNEKIFMIGGNNFQQGIQRGEASYYFSRYTHIWGWATWARAWQKYDFRMNSLESFIKGKKISKITQNKYAQEFWLANFESVKNKKVDTWDYQLTFSCWNNENFTIIPNENLVSNIGFRFDATHTKAETFLANMPTKEIKIEKHPPKIAVCREADDYLNKNIYKFGNNSLFILQAIKAFLGFNK